MKRKMINWVRHEPLAHFVLIGIVLYGVQSLKGHSRASRAVLAPEELAQARSELRRELRRELTTEEDALLGAKLIDEAVLVKEAVALGLDRGDAIVRRRLAQKMLFLAEDWAAGAEPTTEELEGWLSEHPDRYQIPALVTFRHVFFRPNRAGSPVVEAAQHQLATGLPVHGDPFLLGERFVGRSEGELERLFGLEFARAVFRATLREWTGPIKSATGTHLVFLEERTGPATPKLAAVIHRVRADMVESRRAVARFNMLRELRHKYGVRGNPQTDRILPMALASEEAR